MYNKSEQTTVFCDGDLDHSFSLEVSLRDRGYNVVNISGATEVADTVTRMLPSVKVANRDIQGFNEHHVCKSIKKE